ncbi:superoxide dismutase family protein [Clostridium paraputrificum]|uniref:superoxide dismutase family protein n=1 Tax=Clostridium paraputrificum TaxID=29363 RepID=UPI001FAD6D62|nr:superoxide dismutase family protein [Clostridium paraputrificum]MDB2109929.1 superoxide dismutase family protein [Clostridium paraputrificum]
MDNLTLSINSIFKSYNPTKPNAFANLEGGVLAPNIRGKIFLFQVENGVYIQAYITGIPMKNSEGKEVRFHGFHIHEKGDCCLGATGNPFPCTGGHDNPTNSPHPFHAGDLPPILSSNGIGILSVYTSYFSVNDILGKSFILHENPDDLKSQPAGNSGKKLACGIIRPYK